MFDLYKIATAVPALSVADVETNKIRIVKMIDEAEKQKANFLCLPELTTTGYTCADLFLQKQLYDKSCEAIRDIVSISSVSDMVILVGAPLRIVGQLYNAAFIIYRGVIRGVAIKTYLPNYNEFYERRWFSDATDLNVKSIMLSDIYDTNANYEIPVGNDLVFNMGEVSFGAEICEDLWAPIPVSAGLALGGAELIFNLSASNDTIGKRDYRRELIKNTSKSFSCDYVYVSSGAGESTTDLSFGGHSVVAENGRVLYENDRDDDNDYINITEIDLGRIKADRIKGKTFKDCATRTGANIRIIKVPYEKNFGSDGSMLEPSKHPFIPSSKNKRLERCNEIFDIQVNGLCKRIEVTGAKLVVGVSGGLDSTLALLVSAKALMKLGKPLTDLYGITMPGFGTTDRTYTNALELMKLLGISTKEISIKEACTLHYQDIGHNIDKKDVTYENVQARERTQILMDFAGEIGGLVVGTGDLSELALGWCTYNADQMSMYGVNASIPKTLVKWMIDSVVKTGMFKECSAVLEDIIDTPISPELLPPDENGEIAQKTEDFVGPYELHDFFLYYMLRFGYTPEKIFFLAKKAFEGLYEVDTIKKWLEVFYKRFFTQQFKRSVMPDGVKVGSICLSPRGDLRMPSDASFKSFLNF